MFLFIYHRDIIFTTFINLSKAKKCLKKNKNDLIVKGKLQNPPKI